MKSFDLLYSRYERALFGYIYRYLGNRQESDEVFHEAFMQVLECREVTFEEGSFRGWIYRPEN